VFFALLCARIATEEVSRSLAGAPHNPGLALRAARGDDGPRGLPRHPALEFERANLAVHDRRTLAARAHA